LDLNQILICLDKFLKKFRFFSFDFCQNFEVRTFSRWLSIRGTEFFWRDIPKNIFFKIFTWVLLDDFLKGFSKFGFSKVEIFILIGDFWVILEKLWLTHAEHTRKQFYRTLSIRGNDFIAHWAYTKQIFAYAQPDENC
jgi:hypothetical protein